MNKIKIPTTRALSFLLAMLMLIGLCLTACNGSGEETTAGTTDSTEATPGVTTDAPSNTTSATDVNKMPYTVEITSEGGLKLKDITVLIYSDATLTVMNGYARTDENGVASFSLPSGTSTYHAVLTEVPNGYELADSYPLSGSETKITLSSELIPEGSLSGTKFKLGDIMHDFTVKTTDGTTFNLAETLKTKKAVLINFWYINCSWCQEEFPYMNSVYQQYSDDIAVIALNPYASDSESAIQTYKAANGLAFPMAKVDTALVDAFGVAAYPTSVMIDRYGCISIIEEGAIVSEAPFIAAFDHFKSENYTQRLEESLQAFVEIPKPDTDMPSSAEVEAAVNGKNGAGITYRAETGEEYQDYIWDFTLTEKNGKKCLVNTNQEATGTSALLYVDVELKAGQAIKFDYFASSERGADMLHVIIDDVQIYQISGESSDWETCYPYVAIKDGKYTIAIAYIKDESENVGEDSIYITNFEICDKSQINVASYIPRNCATERLPDGYGYANYATVVFNEKDGYYHVGTADGPLLLANLMGYNTTFAEASVFDLAYAGLVTLDGVNYYDQIVQYCNYASNAAINGVCTVDKNLAELLKKVAYACGLEVENDNQWLQMCCYYDVYGGAEQLADPIRGLAAHSAFIAEMGKDNVVTYDRPIMPRGLMYKFVPEKSGAYRITSNSESQVDAWIFNADRSEYYTYEGGERMYTDPNNCSMVVYFEAGRDYYIDIAYYDVYQTGTFTFTVEYLAEKYDHFTLASPGYFTFVESDGVTIGETIAGGIDVILGDDGYYHELREDGSIGSIIYADFTGYTPIFSASIVEMVSRNAFNFKYTEDDLYILYFYLMYGDKMDEQLKLEWGEFYDQYYVDYKVADVVAGIYHGKGDDYSSVIREYAAQAVDNPTNPERSGCVPVDAKLAEILQALMNKYTFDDVDHSWTKVCYYYQYIGAPTNP